MFLGKLAQIPSSTEEFSTENMTIYPNPVRDVLFITNGKDYTYYINDITGRIVKRFKATDGKIDVSELESGIYILNSQGVTIKFIKE